MPVRTTPSPAALAGQPHRTLSQGYDIPRSRGAAGGGPAILAGHFAVFNEWTEINSLYEGNFMERLSYGAFAGTFAADRDRMRCIFQHGLDGYVGEKPLGPIDTLAEDDTGARYEVPLLAAGYVDDLIPGLEAGVYGASFRFRVLREEFFADPGTSTHNPKGLPERTVLEAQVFEFGPVTFPAYLGASAGLRSLTDWWMAARSQSTPGGAPPSWARI